QGQRLRTGAFHRPDGGTGDDDLSAGGAADIHGAGGRPWRPSPRWPGDRYLRAWRHHVRSADRTTTVRRSPHEPGTGPQPAARGAVALARGPAARPRPDLPEVSQPGPARPLRERRGPGRRFPPLPRRPPAPGPALADATRPACPGPLPSSIVARRSRRGG